MSYYNQGQPPVGAPPAQGYPPEGYPKDAYPPAGYPQQGYPPHGYPPNKVPTSVSHSIHNHHLSAAQQSPGFHGRMFGCSVLLLLVGILLLNEVWMGRWCTSQSKVHLGNQE
ncbi:hypothetical protein Tco_0478971 [Tanacetum coccineum]